MVHEIEQKKFVFAEALLLAVLILTLGFSWGFFLENYRTNKIIENYKEFEIEALDLKLQNYYFQIMDKDSCNEAIEQNFIFADELYSQGLELEKYEEAAQISEDIKQEKKRYVLLKTELWLNTQLLNEKCESNLNTIVYLYENNPSSQAKNAQQKIISNVLKNVKEQKGNSIILLPIAGDLDLEAVEMQKRIYQVENLPSIIINEEVVLEGFQSEEEIISHLKR